MAIKIAIKKTVQDFEIGNKTYSMDFRDEKIKEYIGYINKITQAIDDTKKIDAGSPEIFDKVEAEMRGFVDISFGKHAYDEIFEEVGKSSVVMADVIFQVINEAQAQMDIFKEKSRLEKKEQYYKTKNK